ncbi:predicted protein [Histoplasma capsulatum G186AR]|uniref:Uncharacterized protein n=1 Tax=Ajellomyces capsulatus (strain G186AR / H82 / ATCC MYA-2454 / RMSCC 2432) TaxID=447093 RepID=C0NQ51_AJECG|nr:uncharacterized protein HCBG_05281 [Histoplasma capsulatum G186AR]EEH07061.1 predicted protein [Histoplasma capsulatum G186AR]
MAGRQIGGLRGQEKLMHFAVYAITTSVSKDRDRAVARSSQQQHDSKMSRIPVPYNMSEKGKLIGYLRVWRPLFTAASLRGRAWDGHMEMAAQTSCDGTLRISSRTYCASMSGDWMLGGPTKHMSGRIDRRILVTSRYHSAYRSASRSPFTLKA